MTNKANEPMPLHEVKKHMDEISARVSIGAGSIVTLKSGGPKMVVAERTADKAHCVWHFDNGDSCWQWFPFVVLQVSR